MAALGGGGIYIGTCWQEYWRSPQVVSYNLMHTPESVRMFAAKKIGEQFGPYEFDWERAVWLLRNPGEARPRVFWLSWANNEDGEIYYSVNADGSFNGATIHAGEDGLVWSALK